MVRYAKLTIIVVTTLIVALAMEAFANRHTDFVDPRIGSEGLGRVCISPCTPFAMVRPSPDCTPAPNSGWLPMPERVDGFAQVHVSGTGGGPKYGNILIQPYTGDFNRILQYGYRESETISLAYYSTTYKNSGITTEITATDRSTAYRISYPKKGNKALKIDPGFFLGESPIPDAREAQQFVGSQIQILSDHEVAGYSRIRGGWNNGRDYTVYFYLTTDVPASDCATWKGDSISNAGFQYDSGEKTGALLKFPESTDTLNVRIGISFISELKARHNYESESQGKTFAEIRQEAEDKWEKLLSKVDVDPSTSEAYKRMLYTALYHTMLMPSDRTGENPRWTDSAPYFDDYYALWDTYRTSMPLLAIIDPQRLADMINSLINIWKRDGFMPDARSGNCNGRTQGGSNADVVIADACVKGITGIDYEEGLRAMLTDATVPPAGNGEAEGRGGLHEYLDLGYVPHGIDRAGNRTVEYSLCDFAIAQVAQRLGKKEIAKKYLKQSESWKNLWRDDYEHDGARGFIMPRDAQGNWLDSLTFGHSKKQHPTYRYTPLTFEGPWYTPWWSMFFYEASSWEYSLSIPHDVDGLITKCGGPKAFDRRLDTFFDKGYFNVNNEPSFMTPLLYHWIGRPDKSSDRIREIIDSHYDDTPHGLPGNDDAGAMSSWLVFNMAGIYPNAGHDYYLIHSPLLKSVTFNLADDKKFSITTEGFSDKNKYIAAAYLNGEPHPGSTLSHADLAAGGELRLVMTDRPTDWGKTLGIAETQDFTYTSTPPAGVFDFSTLPQSGIIAPGDTLRMEYKLHGQTRRFKFVYRPTSDGGMILEWNIMRNLKLWTGIYKMTARAIEEGNTLSTLMPEDGKRVKLQDNETFGIISRKAYYELKSTGEFSYSGVTYKQSDTASQSDSGIIEVYDPEEGSRMRILDNSEFPLIVVMDANPLEINWKLK